MYSCIALPLLHLGDYKEIQLYAVMWNPRINAEWWIGFVANPLIPVKSIGDQHPAVKQGAELCGHFGIVLNSILAFTKFFEPSCYCKIWQHCIIYASWVPSRVFWTLTLCNLNFDTLTLFQTNMEGGIEQHLSKTDDWHHRVHRWASLRLRDETKNIE